MRTYITRRLLQGVLVLWLVSLLIFSLVRILPGDAVLMQLDQAAAPTPPTFSSARGKSWGSTVRFSTSTARGSGAPCRATLVAR